MTSLSQPTLIFNSPSVIQGTHWLRRFPGCRKRLWKMSEMASWTNLYFSVDVANVLVTSGERPTLLWEASSIQQMPSRKT